MNKSYPVTKQFAFKIVNQGTRVGVIVETKINIQLSITSTPNSTKSQTLLPKRRKRGYTIKLKGGGAVLDRGKKNLLELVL